MAATSKTVQGYITIVQEQRFRLKADSGQGYLFTLSHSAHVAGSGLEQLRDSHTHVEVVYEGEPNTASGIAHAVRII